MVAASTDSQEKASETVNELGLHFPVGYNLPLKEVASILGIPEGTAKSRMRLALARLRTMIGPENAPAWT